jgi:hypothetical protein
MVPGDASGLLGARNRVLLFSYEAIAGSCNLKAFNEAKENPKAFSLP